MEMGLIRVAYLHGRRPLRSDRMDGGTRIQSGQGQKNAYAMIVQDVVEAEEVVRKRARIQIGCIKILWR